MTVKRGTLVKRGTFSRFREDGGGRILFLAIGYGYGYFFSFPSSPRRKNKFFDKFLQALQLFQSLVLLLIDLVIISSRGSSCMVTPDSSSIVLCVWVSPIWHSHDLWLPPIWKPPLVVIRPYFPLINHFRRPFLFL